MDFMNSHPEYPWDWFGLSCNSNLTTEVINSHPEKPWDWTGISVNSFELLWDKSYFETKSIILKKREILENFGMISDITRLVTNYFDIVF